MSVPVPLRLRPLEIGDLLDETFRMYRRHFLLFAGISVLLAVPSAAVYGLVFALFAAGVSQSSGPGFDIATGFWIAFAFAGLLGLLFLPFTHSAVTYAACESAMGRPVTAGGVFAGVLRRYFPLLGYWLLFNVVTAYIALILCLAPFALWTWVFVMWVAVTPAMFVENIGIGFAVTRSRSLVQGRWWRTFFVLFLTFVAYEAVGIALGGFVQLAQILLTLFVSPFVASAITIASGQLVSALLTPIMQIVIVLIYFDLRVRREALDLFQMAHRLAAPAAPA